MRSMEVFMKMKGLKLVLFALVGLVLFVSCGPKKYAGFEVQDGFIMIPTWNEETDELFPFPLDLYKLMESELKEVVSVFNKFDTVSEMQYAKFFSHYESFENMDIYSFEDYPEDTQDSLEELTNDAKLVSSIMSSLKYSKPYLDYIDDIVCDFACDELEQFLYFFENMIDYENGSDYYESKEEIFVEAIEEYNDYWADFHNKYFSHIKIETDYSKTAGSKKK